MLRGRWADLLAARFDLIVSNPPYIASGELDALEPEVRLHDPRLALDGGADGFDCYREIVEALPRLLAPTGAAALEAGDGQARSLAALLAEKGLEPAGILRTPAGASAPSPRGVAAEASPSRDILATPPIYVRDRRHLCERRTVRALGECARVDYSAFDKTLNVVSDAERGCGEIRPAPEILPMARIPRR